MGALNTGRSASNRNRLHREYSLPKTFFAAPREGIDTQDRYRV
jgi:hypothetical protein